MQAGSLTGENPFWENSYNKNQLKGAICDLRHCCSISKTRIGNWVEERALRQDADPDLKYELKSWADSTKRFARGNEKPDAHSTKLLTGMYSEYVEYTTTNRLYHNGADPKAGLPPTKGKREALLEQEMLMAASQRAAPQPPAGEHRTEYRDTIGRTGAMRLGENGETMRVDGTVVPEALHADWRQSKLYTEKPITVYTHNPRRATGRAASVPPGDPQAVSFAKDHSFSTPVQEYTKGPVKIE
eukprot:tig00021537_g22297.t1